MEKMKSNIEKLEEEHQKTTLDCQSKEVTIFSLQEDHDLKETKVAMLEAMVTSLSQGGAVPTQPKWKLPWGNENKNEAKLDEANIPNSLYQTEPSLRSRFSSARITRKKPVS
jgi:hypothetical protein